MKLRAGGVLRARVSGEGEETMHSYEAGYKAGRVYGWTEPKTYSPPCAVPVGEDIQDYLQGFSDGYNAVRQSLEEAKYG